MSVRIRPGDPELGGPQFDGDVRALFGPDADSRSGAGPTGPAPVRPRRGSASSLVRPFLGSVRWTHAVAVSLVATVLLAVLGGLAWRLSIPAPAAQPGSVAPTGVPARSPSPTTTPTTPPSLAPTPEPEPVAHMSAVAWQGSALPVSRVDGPLVFTATRAEGFTRSRVGAALAAVHISTHIDAYTGPDVFEPTITEQVLRPGRLLQRTRTAYATVARQAGVDDGGAVLAPTGSISSWRIDRFRPRADTGVDLLVRTPAGDQVVYHVVMQWARGDWRLRPLSTDATFDVARAGDTSDFTSFMPLQTPEGEHR